MKIHANNEQSGEGKLTTAAVVAASNATPEFLDHYGVRAVFGIPRSTAYQLLDLGLIKSVSMRKVGGIRGKRLFDAESIRGYLRGLQKAGEKTAKPTTSAANS